MCDENSGFIVYKTYTTEERCNNLDTARFVNLELENTCYSNGAGGYYKLSSISNSGTVSTESTNAFQEVGLQGIMAEDISGDITYYQTRRLPITALDWWTGF